MTDANDDLDAGSTTTASAGSERNLGRRVIFIVVAVAALAIAYLVGAAVIPRWWAQRVGNMIDGRIAFGNFLGFASGFLFTLLPMFVIMAGWRFRKTWKRAAVFLVFAIIAAMPNLLTLGIVLGNGNAASQGRSILDNDGPGFRGGSLVGAIVGLLISLVIWWLLGSRRRNKRKAAELEAELGSK